ncbi:hypothetical protein LS684_02005 [Cytobacillus spongiae]|jgi:hypothetical protein|uniref:hypothetical protein n=1 Tax=Cytobacillus spongiae TaxID=2901381 RepID=UPI001F2C1A83|nr:hypothetical protein [Cytobacillus spongiae]UII56286.1 hypothetical protein LS684_02005 [Cytobacillus spongiae]
MNKNKLQIVMFIVLFGSIIFGGLLGVYLIYKNTGVFHSEWIPAIIGGVLLGFIPMLLRKKRGGTIPDVDERSMMLYKKYFMAVLYLVLFGSGAGLLILFLNGVKYIETGMLIIYLMVIYMLIGLGVLVVKRL